MVTEHLKLLRLFQPADGAIPTGAAAHPFRLETPVEGGAPSVGNQAVAAASDG